MRDSSLIFKIVEEAEWRDARPDAAYGGSEADKRDGFIHLSAEDQVAATAAKWFAGRTGLLLVAVDGAALGADLRWEVSRGGESFPHLYGVLPVSAVVWERRLTLDVAGQFQFGPLSR